MKKLLGLLGTILVTGNAIPSVIAAAPNRKHSIKKRQTTPTNEENQQTKTRTSNDSQDGHSTTEFIEKEITLNENYSHNIQKILQELIKNNQLDPLRMINNEGIVRTDYFETQDKRNERENNIKIIEKLDEILELKKFDANKIRILVLTLKNKENNKIKLIINLDNLYLQGFINENNEYFYFDDELLEKIKQNNQEEIIKLNDLRDKLNNLKDNKLLFNEEKVKEYLQKKNKIIPLKEKEKNNKKLNYNNELNYLNKKIIILCGESLKTEEIKTKTLNTKVTEKYNCQKINLNYTGAYSENGLDVVIKEKGKPNRAKDIIISRDTLNNAIANLAKFSNDKNKNQTTKDDLVRMIFITSEAMRFGSYLKYFNYEKDSKQVEFKNIQENIQNIINSKNDDKIQWKDYSEQLIGGWVASSKYVEEKRKEIFKSLDITMSYYEILSNIGSNKNDYEKINFEFNLPSNIEEMKNLITYSINDNNFDDKKLREKLKIEEKYVAAIEVIKKQIEQLNNNKYMCYLSDYEKKIMDLIKEKIIDNFKMNILISSPEIRRTQIPVPSKNVKLFGNNKFSNFENNFLHLVYIDSIKNKNSEIKRNKDILELLLIRGANVNSKNNELGIPLLHIAIYNEELDIVGLLLDYGADVNIQDKNGETVLHKTIMNKNLEKTEKLDILKLLLKQPKINVNLGDKNIETVLHRAVKLNNLKIVNELLTNPNSKDCIFVNALNNCKITPLHYAANNDNLEMVKLLINKGADVNISNICGKKPIDFCKNKEINDLFKKIKELKEQLDRETQDSTVKIQIQDKLKKLLGKEFVSVLSIFVENHNLGEIADNNKKTILNTFIEKNEKLKKLFLIGQLYVTNITDNSAIINSPAPNIYTGIVPVTFTIAKKIKQPNQSHIKIIEDEYKKQGATPKGSKVIPNQHSNTDNSKVSVGDDPTFSGTQQQINQYDVPSDNSCLFWSVATAYLLPVRNNNEEFKNRFIQLFGEENLKYLQLIQKLLKQYDLENNRNLNQLWYQNQIANNLVTNVFRNRVVDYIRGNLDNPTQINSQINQIETFRSAIQISENEININNYLERMRQSSSWGGQLEILAIGNLLGSNINVNNRNIFETNNPNANLQVFHVNENHYNFILLQNTNEENIINSQEKNTDIQKQQKLTEAEKPKTNITILNKPIVNNNTNLSVNKPIKINIANSQETTIKKAINKYNALSKEEKQQKLNEINQHYQSLPENEQKTFKDKLRDVGLGLTSTGISGAGILGISKMTGISPTKGLSTTANYIKNSLSTSRSVVSAGTGEAVEMTPLLSESTVAEDLTAAETLSATEGAAFVATEGAVIGTEAGTAAALAPETLGLSLLIGGLVIAGTSIIWWLSSHDGNTTVTKHESHNQYNKIEKYYKFLAHDQLKLDININEWNKIKQIYQENSNNYQEFKNKIKSEITNFHKEDHSGWGGSITDDDINILINVLYNHFQEINNHFLSNPNHGWKIVTNTIGSYFIIEEE